MGKCEETNESALDEIGVVHRQGMSYERALEVLSRGSSDVDEVLEANMIAFDAVKQRIPQKPRCKRFYHPICPLCGKAFTDSDGRPKHCPNCGQALLWEGV